MGLPANGTPWPPKQWHPVFEKMDEWAAWWEGDPARLHSTYQQERGSGGSSPRRGLAGFLQRFFWGRRQPESGQPSRGDLHIPIAADLCATSAELLYSEPPSFDTDNERTRVRLDAYIEDGLFTQLQAGADVGAALGGRYHRVTWDTAVSDMPFLSTVHADHALPEFRWGRLVAVTFWTVVEVRGSTYVRHVERHELNQDGNGLVFHGLYEGTHDNLGMLVPLPEHPATAGLAATVNDQGHVDAGITPGLMVAYVPNAVPNKRWRTHPAGKDLGRSDLDGVEALMDALDEVYSSWMRDIRLGKARVFADRAMLEAPNGQPLFNLDQEVFTPLDGLAGSMSDAVPIHPQQFAIRVQEHADTAADLVRRIVRGARYSASTFGDDVADTDVTATEVKARQASTMTTRAKKIQLEKPALTRLVRKLLLTDQAVFDTPGLDVDGLAVVFPDLVTTDPHAVAQTIATLKNAGVMSTKTAVEMAHPDWTPDQVEAEVDAINQANPLTSPDDWTHTGWKEGDDEETTG